MSINGVEGFRFYALSKELRNKCRSEEAVRAVFGTEPVVVKELPSPGQVDAVLWQIEELCSGYHGTVFNGVYTRQLHDPELSRSNKRLQLTWNAAGILWGSGLDPVWDGAIASINNLSLSTKPGVLCCVPVHTEGLYIPHAPQGEALTPLVRRTIWRRTGPIYADRPASAHDVRIVSELLTQFVHADSMGAQEEAPTYPIYAEIGFGIDPAAFRGRRSYHKKSYLGIDQAVGEYENSLGSYPDAVRMLAKKFSEDAKNKRSDEHISFMLGDVQKLGLPSHSIREVFMSNVVNAPLDDHTRTNILHEARRLIEREGTLVLRINWHQDVWPEMIMVETLRQHGFVPIRSVSHNDPEYSHLETQYGTPTEVPAPAGYFLIARRVV